MRVMHLGGVVGKLFGEALSGLGLERSQPAISAMTPAGEGGHLPTLAPADEPRLQDPWGRSIALRRPKTKWHT